MCAVKKIKYLCNIIRVVEICLMDLYFSTFKYTTINIFHLLHCNLPYFTIISKNPHKHPVSPRAVMHLLNGVLNWNLNKVKNLSFCSIHTLSKEFKTKVNSCVIKTVYKNVYDKMSNPNNGKDMLEIQRSTNGCNKGCIGL